MSAHQPLRKPQPDVPKRDESRISVLHCRSSAATYGPERALMLMVDAGQITLGELERGYVLEPADPAKAKTINQIVEQVRRACTDFSVPEDTPARFAVGDHIRTLRQIAHSHTRLPAYARDCEGEVIAHHGSHLFPDEGAHNRHVGQHLYTVSFSAQELWGQNANPRDTVTLELWESYLVPA